MSSTIGKLMFVEDELHETAIRRTGFHDFGNPGYRQGLRIMLEAYDTDVQLTKDGWHIVYDRILGALIARLFTQHGWAEHPDVLATPIRRPLVIVGPPRTGTTALHRLLSVDRQFQGLEFWLLQTPMIRPPRETWDMQPSYRDCIAKLEARYARTPRLRTMHVFGAGEVEECRGVLFQSFMDTGWHAYSLPTYARWFLSQSAREAYYRYSDVLRLIGASESHRTWLLKSPDHMAKIDTLLETFPDARIIQTHRDPVEAIPSACSVLFWGRRELEGEAAQIGAFGQRTCEFWRNTLDRMQAVRQRFPCQFVDVDHRRFLQDPLGVVRSVYDHFGLTLAPGTEEQMRAWAAANPTSKHGKHEYNADAWGVTTAQIRNAFADYRAEHQFT